MNLIDEDGRHVVLGARVGPRGGEGEIFKVADVPASVAKIYHQPPDARKNEKLRRLRSLAAPGLQEVAAWPTRLLFHAGSRQLIGFVMPFQAGRRVEQLYSPRDRLREFPKAGWDFLLHVACNCAAAFETLHEHGIVMADVNEGNVLVTDKGIARLIDCDSYQVQDANGRPFTCDVGVPLWTPPELQNLALGNLVRTADHDRFGLAVLIFHLLFMGRHPYAGVPVNPTSDDDGQLEKAIAHHRFAYASHHLQLGVRPPPHALAIGTLPGAVARLFERAFLPAAAASPISARPSGREWAETLRAVRLRRCAANPLHNFPEEAGDCPWCRIFREGGPAFFALPVVDDRAMTAQIEALWQVVRDKVPAAMIPRETSAFPCPLVQAKPLPVKLKRVREEFYLGWFFLVVAVCCLCAAPSMALFAFITAAVGLAGIHGGRLAPKYRAEIERRRAEAARLTGEQQTLQTAAQKIAQDYRSLYQKQFGEMEEIYRRHGKLTAERTADIQKLEANKRDVQFRAHLDNHLIARANIPGIGPNLQAVLRACGIESALDITSRMQVPGVGPTRRNTLIAWRQAVEARFVFNPATPLPKQEVDAIEQRLRDTRLRLEVELRTGVATLERSVGQARQALARIETELAAVIPRQAQAAADASLK